MRRSQAILVQFPFHDVVEHATYTSTNANINADHHGSGLVLTMDVLHDYERVQRAASEVICLFFEDLNLIRAWPCYAFAALFWHGDVTFG